MSHLSKMAPLPGGGAAATKTRRGRTEEARRMEETPQALPMRGFGGSAPE